MNAPGSVTTSPLAYFLQDKPQALAELGAGVLKLSYPSMNPEEVPNRELQQVGYIVTQVMLGKPFPEIDLQDSSICDSYKITKINSNWVKAVLFQGQDVRVRTEDLALYAINKAVQTAPQGTTTASRHIDKQLLDELEKNGMILPQSKESTDRAVLHLATSFKDGICRLHPQPYVGNPLSWDLLQLRIFSLMKSCKDSYQKSVIKIDRILRHYDKSGELTQEVLACVPMMQELYHRMLQDLKNRFRS